MGRRLKEVDSDKEKSNTEISRLIGQVHKGKGINDKDKEEITQILYSNLDNLYDDSIVYDIARQLKIPQTALPCLVFLMILII